ncbi:hypothetical protein OFB65_26835, partial [Escherichia coli]|nr:hypothetical protein [Escherichia coli]
IDLLQVDIATLTNQLLNYTNINTYFATQPSEDISASSTSSSNPTIVSTPTPTAANMSVPRLIRKVFLATEQAEGAGARVRR